MFLFSNFIVLQNINEALIFLSVWIEKAAYLRHCEGFITCERNLKQWKLLLDKMLTHGDYRTIVLIMHANKILSFLPSNKSAMQICKLYISSQKSRNILLKRVYICITYYEYLKA